MSDDVTHLTELILQLCRIPSPTGQEQDKARYVLEQLRGSGAEEAYMDSCGNVLYAFEPRPGQPYTLFAAHIDTVFGGLARIDPVIRDGRLYAPSAGDNCANVAALLGLACKLRRQWMNKAWRKNLLFAFNVGEEGLGNLKGMKHVMNEWSGRIDEAVAVDGQSKRVVNEAVGSKRMSVRLAAEGGHSWGKFGSASAIAEAAAIIHRLYQIKPAASPKTTYNVGTFSGGTSVNTIAESAEFLLDIRSVDKTSLDKLEQEIREVLEHGGGGAATVEITMLGERPCGKTDPESGLVRRITAVRARHGLDSPLSALSTDANIPMSQGVPAVAFGVYTGQGAHTMNEYVELDSLRTGLKVLEDFILSYAGERGYT